jgi:hypothetical protein
MNPHIFVLTVLLLMMGGLLFPMNAATYTLTNIPLILAIVILGFTMGLLDKAWGVTKPEPLYV